MPGQKHAGKPIKNLSVTLYIFQGIGKNKRGKKSQLYLICENPATVIFGDSKFNKLISNNKHQKEIPENVCALMTDFNDFTTKMLST